ncbi:hypothetical protein [Wielerella bovis]
MGKMCTESKEYVAQNDDAIHFLFRG